MYLRRQFLEHIAQTSEIPQGFEISRSEGCYLLNNSGEKYLDLVSGFGVNNIGHGIRQVQQAIHRQVDLYLHSNVYGEHVQSPQIQLASYLAELLPSKLSAFYFLSTGSECVDAAIKLAKLATGRYEIITCKNAYHGSTIAAESLRSDENHKSAFMPLMPGVRFIEFNEISELQYITNQTAAVITEVVQAEAGVRLADKNYFIQLKKRCEETGTLMVFDEMQTGIGRTGKLFAFQHYDVVPDILLSGKALGAGLPLSALICSKELMRDFIKRLPLGYLTTFGGHPVSCAAGLAGLKYLMKNKIMEEVEAKANFIKNQFKHPDIKQIRHCGLLIAVELNQSENVMRWIKSFYNQNVLVESYLFCPQALRVAPPLIISNAEISKYLKMPS